MQLRAGWSVLVVTFGLAIVSSRAAAQAAPAPRDVLVKRWNEIGAKIVKLAQEFPEEKYDFRPVPGVRTFAEQLRHVGFWNVFVDSSLHNQKMDPAPNELAKTEYPTKASIVAILKTTVARVGDDLMAGPTAPDVAQLDLLVTFIEHSGEHYGQLVVYYRLNGMVPPESRGNAQ